jgi:hypothetical protein
VVAIVELSAWGVDGFEEQEVNASMAAGRTANDVNCSTLNFIDSFSIVVSLRGLLSVDVRLRIY